MQDKSRQVLDIKRNKNRNILKGTTSFFQKLINKNRIKCAISYLWGGRKKKYQLTLRIQSEFTYNIQNAKSATFNAFADNWKIDLLKRFIGF